MCVAHICAYCAMSDAIGAFIVVKLNKIAYKAYSNINAYGLGSSFASIDPKIIYILGL